MTAKRFYCIYCGNGGDVRSLARTLTPSLQYICPRCGQVGGVFCISATVIERGLDFNGIISEVSSDKMG